MQSFFRKQKSEGPPPHTSTSLADHNLPPPINRIGRMWRSAFRKENVAEKTRPPIEIQVDESGQRVLLEDLGIVTSERLNSVGVCTFEVVHTKKNGRRTCLAFTVNAVPGEIGGRFSQVNLNVRLLDLANIVVTSPTELIIDDIILDDPGAQSISRNATEESEQKGTISWTMIEKVGTGRGVTGRHTFRLQTTSLPFNAEINVSAKYLKDGKTKVFEIPGKDKFLEYRLVNLH